MEFKQVYYFLEVCKDGSFTKTAKRLFITQQGLNKSILLLEQELGCKLFDRSLKKLSLTHAGKVFYDDAEKMMVQYKEMIEKMLKYCENPTLHICVVKGTGIILQENMFDAFVNKYPNIKLELKECNNDECFKLLEDGEADVIIANPNISTNTYKSTLLHKEEITLVVSKDNPLAKKEKIQLQDLDGKDLVMFEGTNIDNLKEILKNKGLSVNAIKKVPEILLVYKHCVNSNFLGIGVNALKNKIVYHDVVEIPFDRNEITLNFEFIYKKSNNNIQLLKNYLLKNL